MRKRLSGLRLVVLLVFMIGLFSPIVATGAAAQDLTCDQFNSQRAAQAVLDADPELEDSLDPDGDGIACNEDEPVDDPTEESTEEPTDDPTEEPSDDPTEESTDDPTEEATDEPSGDDAAYLEDIQAEVDTVIESFERQLEINTTIGDASSSEQLELVDELEELAATWSEYPDVAAEFEAPAGLEDVEDAYLDFTDLVGETGDTWLIWWGIPQGDPDEDAALDDFVAAIEGAYAAADDVTAAIEDAGGSTIPSNDPTEESTEEPTDDPTEESTEEPTDDSTEEPSADGDAYVADVQAELDALTEEVDAFNAIFDLGADVTRDDADEANDIAAGWVGYPDVAFELVAPEGYEDIEDAYLDLADTVGETGELWEAYWAIDPDLNDEEEIALDEFETAFADVEDQIVTVQDLLDDAGASTDPGNDDPTEEPTDDPTEEATEEPSGDSDDYLTTVSDTAADWQDSIDRFAEILAQGEDITDAESTELGEIVTAWISAPSIVAELEAPAGLDDVQAAYEDYADELSNAGLAFTEWATADVGSPEEDAALDDFTAALEEAQTLYADLEDLLADEGA